MGIDKFLFADLTSDYFLCTVCFDVVDGPVISPCCKSLFCRECYFSSVSETFPGSPNCRKCKKDSLLAVDFIDGPLKIIYDDLKMRCRSKSCQEVLKVRNYKQHICTPRRTVTPKRGKSPVSPNCKCSNDLSGIVDRLNKIETELRRIPVQNPSSGREDFKQIFIGVVGFVIAIYFTIFLLFSPFMYEGDSSYALPPQ